MATRNVDKTLYYCYVSPYIPPLSVSLRKRRLQFAGHCLRTTDQPVSKLIFWTPSYGHSKRGRKCTTYPDSIVKDLDLEPNEIQQLMKDKTVWRKFVSAASTIPSKLGRHIIPNNLFHECIIFC